MTTQVDDDERVVIVGAGPVGLVTAWSLVRAGVPVTVLERGDGPGSASRASTFHPPTLALLEELGLVDILLEQGLRAPTFQYRDRQDGVIALFDLGILADEFVHPFRIQFEQDKFCAEVAKRLAGEPLARILTDHRVADVTSDASGATVTAQTPSGDVEVRGAWVIGADGAHSAVREACGIAFEGLTYDERFLVVSTYHDVTEQFADLSYVNYVTDPDEWFVLLRTPDHWRVLFPVDADEEHPDAPERVLARLRGVAGPDAEVLSASAYAIQQRVAATFRQGRVLLAGDAAHINNPLGGLGMNSGLHDAVSLGYGLAQVWHGLADDSALDRYASVRREVAQDVIDRQTRANYERIRDRDPKTRAAHHDELRATVADPERTRAYLRTATLADSARRALDGTPS